jgi:hypothetical protein
VGLLLLEIEREKGGSFRREFATLHAVVVIPMAAKDFAGFCASAVPEL